MFRQSVCAEEDKPPPIPARQPVSPSLPSPHGGPDNPAGAAPRPSTPVPNRRTKPAFPRTKSQGSAGASPDVKPLRVILPRQAISIRTLAELYSNYFPSRVIVAKQLGPLLQSQDMINVHFVKRRPTMRVVARNLHYLLPLNSAGVKVGFLHESYNAFPTCRSAFETVADLVAASPIPKVVCSRRRWGGGDIGADPQSGVAAGEVLAILDVAADLRGQKVLRAYSYLIKSAKILPMDCAGSFTLCPNEIKLTFSELLNNAAVPFPWSVVLFPDGSGSVSSHPRDLFDDVVTITACAETVSVACTRYTAETNGTEVIDLPVDTPLEVKCVCLSEAHEQALKAHSAEVAERYDESSVRYITGERVESAVSIAGFAGENALPVSIFMGRMLCEECVAATSRDRGSPRRPTARSNLDGKTPPHAIDIPSLVQRYDSISKDVNSLR